jgi:hypothetical protein
MIQAANPVQIGALPEPRILELKQDTDWIVEATELITHNPTLRANYFLNPDGVVDRAIKQYMPHAAVKRSSPERRRLRSQLGAQIEQIINKDTRLISARESYFERRAFLAEALRNPQRTFEAILILSIASFVVSVVFLVVAVVAAIGGEAEIGAFFGAGSIVSLLGTTLTLSRDSIRQANTDNAQIRLILTDFATQLTHFRAIPIHDFDDANKRNRAIRTAMADSVKHLQPRPEATECRAATER